MSFRDFAKLRQIERKRIVMPDNVLMRLNRGERPEPLPYIVRGVIQSRLMNCVDGIQHYPSYSAFYKQLAEFHGIETSQLVVGAGIEEFIRTLMFLYCAPGDKAAVLWPTCAMYDIYAAAFEVDLIRVKPVPGQWFEITDYIAQIPRDCKLVFLPNPGQPVETYFDSVEIEVLAEYCAEIGAVLAVDEAHFGFGSTSAFEVAQQFTNVIVMRTFSKYFGAASIRVGYIMGSSFAVKPIEAARPSGEIAGPSMLIASVLLEYSKLLFDDAIKIQAARDYIRQRLIKMGLFAWGKQGFSILVDLQSVETMQAVVDGLAKRGVLVKGNFPAPVDKHILFSCGFLDMMSGFGDIFQQVYCDIRC